MAPSGLAGIGGTTYFGYGSGGRQCVRDAAVGALEHEPVGLNVEQDLA
jgi:hypothetical protein